MVFTGFYCVVLGCFGLFYWDLKSFTGLYWPVLGFMGFT